jgi:hypothetical protein
MHILFGIHWGCPLGHVVVQRMVPVVAIIHKEFFSFLDISPLSLGKSSSIPNSLAFGTTRTSKDAYSTTRKPHGRKKNEIT